MVQIPKDILHRINVFTRLSSLRNVPVFILGAPPDKPASALMVPVVFAVEFAREVVCTQCSRGNDLNTKVCNVEIRTTTVSAMANLPLRPVRVFSLDISHSCLLILYVCEDSELSELNELHELHDTDDVELLELLVLWLEVLEHEVLDDELLVLEHEVLDDEEDVLL